MFRHSHPPPNSHASFAYPRETQAPTSSLDSLSPPNPCATRPALLSSDPSSLVPPYPTSCPASPPIPPVLPPNPCSLIACPYRIFSAVCWPRSSFCPCVLSPLATSVVDDEEGSSWPEEDLGSDGASSVRWDVYLFSLLVSSRKGGVRRGLRRGNVLVVG
jgi:hypothetical protein